MLELRVKRTDYFHKLVKALKKKYPRIERDIDHFLNNISEVRDIGIPLGRNLYKARLSNSDASKGKSGGYRLISYLTLQDNNLTLIYIYSKSDLASISESDLDNTILKSL